MGSNKNTFFKGGKPVRHPVLVAAKLSNDWTGHLIAQWMVQYGDLGWIFASLIPGEASC